MDRVILHCDMNNYFASVEEKFDPALKQIPFAVCGDPEMRHNIVMAKNSLAKKAGVITGLSFYQAKEVCPGLGYVRANMPRYLIETKIARKTYQKYTDAVIPYGLDEAWLDLTETGVSLDEGRQIADLIRYEIMYSQGLSASVGVSDNLIFAKLGSDYKKPNATTLITRDNYRQIIWPLPASDLLFIGPKRKRVLLKYGIKTIGDIAGADPEFLRKILGKVGYDVWMFANGDDNNFNPDNEEIGSLGNTITPPEDLNNNKEACAIIYLIINSICARLEKHDLKACCVGVTMKDNKFNTMLRQRAMPLPTDNINYIFDQAYELLLQNYKWNNPLRSIGVKVDNLIKKEQEQITLFDDDDCEICVDIDEQVRLLTARFGELKVENTAMARE